jgi:hypothetical protein
MFPLLTVKVETGRLPAVENDRREEQQPTTPPPEASHHEDVRREWESSGPTDVPRDPERGERSAEGPPPYESAPPHDGGGQSVPPGQGAPMGPGGRGRRRGGRGRMSGRDRRPPPRGGRGRDSVDRGGPPPYRPGPPSGGGHPGDERERERDEPRYSDIPPEQRSLIQQAKAEVERIRETLDGVLRDLEDVCEQLTRAEHEKDLAEAEIEQLRDQLRRLHR